MAEDVLNKYDFIFTISVYLIVISAVCVAAKALAGDMAIFGFLPDFTIPVGIVVIFISAVLIKISHKRKKHGGIVITWYGWIRSDKGPGGSASRKEAIGLLLFALVLIIVFYVFVFVLLPGWV